MGGGGCYNPGQNDSSGNSGGSSSFSNLISCTGGGGAYNKGGYYSDSENNFEGYPRAGSAGSPNGNAGALCKSSSYSGGGAGFALGFGIVSGSYGKGRRCEVF